MVSKEKDSQLPVAVRGPRTSVLKLPIIPVTVTGSCGIPPGNHTQEHIMQCYNSSMAI